MTPKEGEYVSQCLHDAAKEAAVHLEIGVLHFLVQHPKADHSFQYNGSYPSDITYSKIFFYDSGTIVIVIVRRIY